MKKSVVLLAVFFIAATNVKSQNPTFPDGGFENCWEEFEKSKGDYYWDFKENYFLTTLNILYELIGFQGTAPLTAYRLTGVDVRNGIYSLQLVSKFMQLGDGDPLFLPGATGTLRIIIDPALPDMGDCELGRPFTSRPIALNGWHKYDPKNGDSAAIEIQLKKGEVELGFGKQIIKEAVTNWATFTVPIEYTSSETPDKIIVIFSASAGYDFTSIKTLMECKGQVNSTLCLDDIEYEYPVGVKEMFDPSIKLGVYPNPSTDRIKLQIGKETKGNVIIYDYLIHKIGEYPINGTEIEIDIQNYPAGSYLINVVEADKVITTSRFLKQ